MAPAEVMKLYASGKSLGELLALEKQPTDSDGDGQSDAAELLAGTDPKNAADVFRVLRVDAGGAITWQAKPGKTYEVEFSDALRTWTIVSPPLTGAGEISWKAERAGLRGWYRVRVK